LGFTTFITIYRFTGITVLPICKGERLSSGFSIASSLGKTDKTEQPIFIYQSTNHPGLISSRFYHFYRYLQIYRNYRFTDLQGGAIKYS